MGLFSRKYDYDKDSLAVVFDLNSMSYKMSKWNQIVPNKRLNWKTIKLLGEYNDKLKDDPDLLKREVTMATFKRDQKQKSENRKQELADMGYNIPSIKVIGFEPGNISQSVLDYLIPMLSEDHVLFGIHRIGVAGIDDAKSIFERGFLMSGGGLNVVQQGGVSLEQNFSIYADNSELLNQLMYANGYKGSKGSIIIRIPDEDVKENKMFSDTVTDELITVEEDGKMVSKTVQNIKRYLKSEYIVGYAPVDENFNVEKFILNPHYGEKKEEVVKDNSSKEKTSEILANILVEKEMNQQEELDMNTKIRM